MEVDFVILKKCRSWAQWHMPAFPVTQEAEARGSFEPRSLRLVSYDPTTALQLGQQS